MLSILRHQPLVCVSFFGVQVQICQAILHATTLRHASLHIFNGTAGQQVYTTSSFLTNL